MKVARTMSVLAARLTAPIAVVFALSWAGCTAHQPASAPVEPVPVGRVEVVGTLTAVKDDRPVDGGIDLTLETAFGKQELVRVPSSFIAGPRDAITAMHAVVDASRIGDRLRARGTRDESGALRPETLERLP